MKVLEGDLENIESKQEMDLATQKLISQYSMLRKKIEPTPRNVW